MNKVTCFAPGRKFSMNFDRVWIKLKKRDDYRIFAFWDKSDNIETFVVATHGIIKKTDKTPKVEIEKARAIMKLYFEQKTKRK